MKNLVTAVFPFKDKLLSAIKKIKGEGCENMEVKMPVPDHDILDAVNHKPTPVGWFTLIGGAMGMITGFVGPAWAHMHWGNSIGGKPIISLPAFIVIMFELTILFGAIATFAGLFILARLPSHKKLALDERYDPRCSDDHYALYVEVDEEKEAAVREIMEEEGAEVHL